MSGISFNLDISHFTAANATGSANYSLLKLYGFIKKITNKNYEKA